MSRIESSPSDSPRMTVTDVWLPALPPVSISIGMNAVRITAFASASSKCAMIDPVKVAEIISRHSHGMRLPKVSKTPVFR